MLYVAARRRFILAVFIYLYVLIIYIYIRSSEKILLIRQ